MKKWYEEEYEWEIEVIGFNKDNNETERFCRNGEEIGDKYTCTYGCPVNSQGQGICSKVMMMMYPAMEAVRSGGNLENTGGDSKYSKVIMCPDGCVLFRITAKPLGNKNFFKGKYFD
ncbi:MAG: TIGR04076 family protein [Eubacterium sp.]|nr:TIGR04076 family protein [Eubacterium sp.]